MTVPGVSAFAAFARRKEEAARGARFEALKTVIDNTARFQLEPVGCPFTDALLDGPYFQTPTSAIAQPAMNLVFVQRRMR